MRQGGRQGSALTLGMPRKRHDDGDDDDDRNDEIAGNRHRDMIRLSYTFRIYLFMQYILRIIIQGFFLRVWKFEKRGGWGKWLSQFQKDNVKKRIILLKLRYRMMITFTPKDLFLYLSLSSPPLVRLRIDDSAPRRKAFPQQGLLGGSDDTGYCLTPEQFP